MNSVVDLDPHRLNRLDPDPGGQKMIHKESKERKKLINVLKCWMFSFEGWRRLLFLDALH
jgi:hypothetical protein